MSGTVLTPPAPVPDTPAPTPLGWDQELALRDRALIFALDGYRMAPAASEPQHVEPLAIIADAQVYFDYLVNGVPQ